MYIFEKFHIQFIHCFVILIKDIFYLYHFREFAIHVYYLYLKNPFTV